MILSTDKGRGDSMYNDTQLIGACGETKLANASASLVTSTQAGFSPS
jgi:hypothetical protein